MSAEIENPYQVLGVERGADERAIKKAYFTLIRKFPPETHPEDFQRLRRAYELLSDPAARRRYDAMDRDYGEYGEQIGAALKSAEESAKAGDDAEVQRKLREILEQRPDLAVVRENLAQSLVRTGVLDEALSLIKALIKERPEEARYQLHKAFVLHRMEKPDKAEAALRKAHKLRPDDVRVHLELIDFLLGYGKWEQAIDELDVMLEKQPPGSDVALLLKLRRVEALCSAKDPEGDAEAARLIEGLDREKDPEIGRFVATQLGVIAARLFARHEAASANALLRRAAELHPESAVLRPYPDHVALDYFALPDEGRRWLASVKFGPPSPALDRPIWPGMVMALLGAAALAGLSAWALFHEPGRWEAATLLGAAIAVAASVAALAFAGRRVIRVLQSPLRAFFTLHPLYLLRADGRRLHVYPLFNLTDVRGVHQHTNGVYARTDFTMAFGKKRVTLAIQGQQYAEGWLQFLLNSRRRALELMGEGFLEAEHGIELLPPALLADPRAAADPRGPARRFHAGVAVAALAIGAAIVPLRARAADDHAFRLAVRGGSVASYQGYLAASPDGRHADEARGEIRRQFDRARQSLRMATDPAAPGAKALFAALDALEARGVTRVPLVMEARPAGVSRGGRAPWGDVEDRLSQLVEAAGLGEVMALEGRDLPDAAAPVSLVVRSMTRPDGAMQRSSAGEDVPTIQVDWEVELLAAGAPDALLRWKTTVAAPEELRLPTREGGERVDVAVRAHEALETRACQNLVRELAEVLGLRGAAAVVRHRGVVGGAAEGLWVSGSVEGGHGR